MEERARSIVVLDDDIDFLEIAARLLQGQGYEVHTFSQADEALNHMKKRKPDLVVTDLMMESLDSGFVFSRRIKETPSLCDVPVIIVTAAASRRGFDFRPSGAEDLNKMHATAFLEKPVNPKLLLKTITDLLKG